MSRKPNPSMTVRVNKKVFSDLERVLRDRVLPSGISITNAGMVRFGLEAAINQFQSMKSGDRSASKPQHRRRLD